jgi:hypothetical protein
MARFLGQTIFAGRLLMKVYLVMLLREPNFLLHSTHWSVEAAEASVPGDWRRCDEGAVVSRLTAVPPAMTADGTHSAWIVGVELPTLVAAFAADDCVGRFAAAAAESDGPERDAVRDILRR